MTTNLTPEFADAVDSARDILRRRIEDIERAREEQPAKLAKAREDAEEARGWALIEEPLADQITSINAINSDTSLSLVDITARELWGARLCFDMLDCGDDYDKIDAVISRLFSATKGDTGITMTILAAALSTSAALVVPQLLEVIELRGSNYEERVRLAEARAKAWNGRAHEIRETSKELDDLRVKPVDAFDIGANAMGPEPDIEDAPNGVDEQRRP